MQKADAIKAKNELHAKLIAKDLDPKLQSLVRKCLLGVGVGPETGADFSVQVWIRQDDPAFRTLCAKSMEGTSQAKIKYVPCGGEPFVPDPIPSSSKRTTKRYYQRLPIFPGVSIGNPQGCTATLGCIVKKDGEPYLLSSGSGIVPTHMPEGGSLPICQPGILDGGHTPDTIAELSQWNVLDPLEPNSADAAIAKIITKAKRWIKDAIDEQIPFGGTGETRPDSPVQKYGRTTGWTVGRLVDLSFNGAVRVGTRKFPFVNQIVVRGINERKKPVDFIQGGDVGAALVHLDAGRATMVGLVIAAMPDCHALASPVSTVFSTLGVSL